MLFEERPVEIRGDKQGAGFFLNDFKIEIDCIYSSSFAWG